MLMPDPHQRIAEGAERHGHLLDDMKRVEESTRYAREVSGSRKFRFGWIVLAVVMIALALFAVYQMAVPTNIALPAG